MLTFTNKTKSVLESKGVTQKELSRLTGIREATISEFVNGRRGALNIQHLIKIMKVLNMDDITEFIEVKRI